MINYNWFKSSFDLNELKNLHKNSSVANFPLLV
jgi:hypothetical protein